MPAQASSFGTGWRRRPGLRRHSPLQHLRVATAVTDGKFVYAYFESQGLYKYDFDGKLMWKMLLGGIATLGVGTG